MVAELPQVSAESPLITAQIPRQPTAKQLACRFTSANAAQMARRAKELRDERERKRREAEESATQSDEQYRLTRLARTRRQIELLDKELENCDEPRDVKAIADAIARLNDVEFALAGRSKPGLTRPGRQPSKTAPASFEPSE